MVHVTRKASLALLALTGIATSAIANTQVTFDNSQTSVGFACNAGLVSVTGRFKEVQGIVEIDENALGRSKVLATIASGSLTTGQATLDSQLKGRSFFDASAHPTIVFQSSAVSGVQVSQSRIMGDLTIKGVTRAVTLEVAVETREPRKHNSNADKQKWSTADRKFRATTHIRRGDFGMTGYDVLVSDECEIEIQIGLQD